MVSWIEGRKSKIRGHDQRVYKDVWISWEWLYLNPEILVSQVNLIRVALGMVEEYGVVYLSNGTVWSETVTLQVNNLAGDLCPDWNVTSFLCRYHHSVVAASAKTAAILSELANIAILPSRPQIKCILRCGQRVTLTHNHVEVVKLVGVDTLDLHCRNVLMIGYCKPYYPLLFTMKV